MHCISHLKKRGKLLLVGFENIGDRVKSVKIGIVGLGTVGGGALNLLQANAAEISRRTGRDIVVTHVGVRRDYPQYNLAGITVSRDIFAVANDPEIDIVVEVMGGTTTARELVLQAIANGKHVVTANKALLAQYGNEIFSAAEAKGVFVAFEHLGQGGHGGRLSCSAGRRRRAGRLSRPAARRAAAS